MILFNRKVMLMIFVLLASVQSITAIAFKCEFVQVGWKFVPDAKTCAGKNVDIKMRNVEIEMINDKSSAKDLSVDAFWIEKQVVHYLPKGIEKFFPNLKSFEIKKSELKEISKFDLSPFPELIRLASESNQLEFVESDLLMYNSKIRYVSFIDNKLFIIGHDLFEPTTNIVYVLIQIGCLKTKCETGRNCLENVFSDMRKNCPSDSIVFDFKRETQMLENELKLLKAKEEALNSCEVDNRTSSKK